MSKGAFTSFIMLLLICVSCLQFTSCVKPPFVDIGIGFDIINNSTRPISFYIAELDEGPHYPDTILPFTLPKLQEIEAQSSYRPFLRTSGTESYFKLLPADTLSVFIFNTDTLLQYDWNTIRSQYKVLKRYDLSEQDLENMNWRITYP